MRNLKKTLAVVLAFVMVLSMGAISTLAYTDVTPGTITDEAVSILSNLNILTGFEDGTFRPEETVTRAQMAAIICRTLGYESQAESSKGFTVFNDVAADHWASGYVNVAQAQGIINGYGDGNFGPEDQVTYEQAVKMIVSALGYDLAAQGRGGYPTGYLAIASAEGITKNANGRVGDAAARATIAVLVYNSLEVQLMDQTSWSTGNDGDKYAKTDDTVLSKYLDVEKVEAVVEATPLTLAVSTSTYEKDAVKYVTLDGDRFFYNGGIYDDASYYGTVDASLVNSDNLLGKTVVAYVGAHADNETGRKMVYAMAEKQGANTVTVINANQLVESSHADYLVDGKISYTKEGARKATDVKFAPNTTVTINGTPSVVSGITVYTNYADAGLTSTADTADIAGQVSNGGVIELISNDNDNLVDYIVITAYANEAVIEKVTDDEGIMIYDAYTGYLNEIDTEDEEELVVVYKDGELADVKAIAENDTVSEISLIGGDIRVLYVSSKTVTGAVESYSTTTDDVTIAGDDYKLSAAFIDLYGTLVDPVATKTDLAISDFNGEEGIFFLNVDGQIAWKEADATVSGNYAYVLAVDYEGGISDAYTAQVLTADGTVAVYDISSKAKLINSSDAELSATDWELAYALATKINDAVATDGDDAESVAGDSEAEVKAFFSTAKKLTYNNAAAAMLKVRIKDDKIVRVEELASSSSSSSKKYDAETMTYQGYELNDEIVIFSLDDTLTGSVEVTADDITLGTVNTFFADGEGYTFGAYDIDDQVPGVILGYDLAAAINQGGDAVIITDVRKISYDDDTAVAITGIQGGEKVAYTLYDDETGIPSGAASLAKGDVILVANATGEGVVDKFEKLHDANTAKNTASVTEVTAKAAIADEIANGYGVLDAANTTNKVFVIGAAIDTAVTANWDNDAATPDTTQTYSFAAANAPIAMIAGANYTLVDFTESTDYPEISKKAPGTALFSKSASYQTEVFVRVYDGVLVDVVVYRYNA